MGTNIAGPAMMILERKRNFKQIYQDNKYEDNIF